MDKFERNSGLFCPHSPLCALKSIPPPAARSPTVAPRGQPARSWRGLASGRGMALAQGSHCPCTPPTRARASSESIPFGARNVWFCRSKPYLLPCKTIPPATPPPRRPLSPVPPGAPWPRTTPRQKAAPRPMKRGKTASHPLSATLRHGAAAREIPPSPHRPCARGSSSRLRLATPRGQPRETSAAGQRSDGMGVFWPSRLSHPLIPEGAGARRKWLGAGASAIGLQRCGHAHCGKPKPAPASFRTKGTTTRNDRAGKPQAYGRDGLAGGERNAPAGRAS